MHPTPSLDPDAIARLRADLEEAAYTVDAVRERLGRTASAALHREQPLAAELATRGASDPVGVLVRLFTLGMPVDSAALAAALPRLGTSGAQALGLVVADGEHWRVTVDLRPYASDEQAWWVVSDLSEIALRDVLPVEHVLGIGGASTTLSSWAIRRPVARALDLGTGCGVQSLHLSQHAETVVGTDISQRALEIARFNAELNELDWDLRTGDMLAPVAGERFDLVVSNPPFVITPRREDVPTYEYRDGGRSGDAIVRELVRGIGEHLEPGGVAQFLGNWEVPRGRDWRDIWAEWLDGTELDAWVIERESQDPAEYAELWARDGGARPGSEEHQRLYAAWLDDFASRDVERIGFGVVTLQRPGGPGDEAGERGKRAPFRSLEEAHGPVAAPMGPTIDAGLRARTWLAAASDEQVLATHWTVAPDVTEERHFRPGDEDPTVILLRQGGGLGRVVRMDTVTAAFVSVADGELTAGAALGAIAQLLEVDEGELVKEALPQIRGLVADGLLT